MYSPSRPLFLPLFLSLPLLAASCGLIANFESIADGSRPATSGGGGMNSSTSTSRSTSSSGGTDGSTSTDGSTGGSTSGSTGTGAGGSAASGYTCLWAQTFEGTGVQDVSGIAVDASSGNLWIAGYHGGVLAMGQTMLSAGSVGINAFVAKFEANTGKPIWAQSFGDTASQAIAGIVAAPNGGVYVSGNNGGTLDFKCTTPPLVSPSSTRIFLARLDGTGACLAARQAEVGTSDRSSALTYDATTDRVFVAGTSSQNSWITLIEASADLGTLSTKIVKSGTQSFVATPEALTFANGRIFVAGNFGGNFDPTGNDNENTVLMGDATRDAFLLGYEPPDLATPQSPWGLPYQVTYTGPGHQTLSAITRRTLGDALFATGRFESSINIATPPILSQGESDIFFVKLSPQSGLYWYKTFGDASVQDSTAIAYYSAHRSILLGGSYKGTLDFGGSPMENPGLALNLFLAEFGEEKGDHLRSSSFPAQGASNTRITAIVTDGETIFIVGAFRNQLDLGCKAPLTASSMPKMFIAALKPTET